VNEDKRELVAEDTPASGVTTTGGVDLEDPEWAGFIGSEHEKLAGRQGNPDYAMPEGIMDGLHADADAAAERVKAEE
jgi:hypothetical protein